MLHILTQSEDRGIRPVVSPQTEPAAQTAPGQEAGVVPLHLFA